MMRNGQVATEILNVAQAHSLSGAEISGHAQKAYDKTARSNVLTMDLTGRIKVPRSMRHSLEVFFPYVVFQVYLPSNRIFTIELIVTDTTGTRRTLIFTATRNIISSAVNTKIPHSGFAKDIWNNLCIDVALFVTESWGTVFNYVNSIMVTGYCRIRKIFALKWPLESCPGPTGYEFPVSLPHLNQHISPANLNVQKLSDRTSPRKRYTTRGPENSLPRSLIVRRNPSLNYSKTPYENPFQLHHSLVQHKDSLRPPNRHCSMVQPRKNPLRRPARTIFYQEVSVSPEPMLKGPHPGYFDRHFVSLTKIRHHTPPLGVHH